MTQMLGSLAGGKVVAMLEVGKAFSLLLTPSSYCINYSKGGYNVDVISECSLAVTKVLLGDAAPMLPPMVASGLATETVYQVALVQAKYWKSVHPKALDSFEGVQEIRMCFQHTLTFIIFLEEIKDIITIPGILHLTVAARLFLNLLSRIVEGASE